jgi:hypothetical protein
VTGKTSTLEWQNKGGVRSRKIARNQPSSHRLALQICVCRHEAALTSIMTSDYFLARKQSGLSDGLESPLSATSPTALRSNPLAAKVTSVLSATYVDSDIRDALSLLDKRGLENSSETRRQLRLNVQKEVIESNGDIIREFGLVAEVRATFSNACYMLTLF